MTTKYGQSNRQVVENTNQGRVDPPVTETGTVSSGGARRQVDQNVGQEGRLAQALVETAGTFGQMATAERHRNERIEGAKLVADGQAESYINETEPTFAEKLFGPKPKLRVAQEMQVQQEMGRLDDQMRKWIEETGHKEDTEAFQEKYDELYKETADRYQDDKMKDLIAGSYAQNLETTRREHAKAKNLFDQQHLLDTTMKGWADSSLNTARDLQSTDVQTRQEALPKLEAALTKPEGMSDSAYRDAALTTAMNDLANGRAESLAVFEGNGVFDDLSYQQQLALDEMKQVHQIKQDSEFNSKVQQLSQLASRGQVEQAEALAREIQLENPKAVDSINSIVNTATAAAQANALAIAENQRDRQTNLEHYKAGRLNLLSPQQQHQAMLDLDRDMKQEAIMQDRSRYLNEGHTTYPEGHALAGQTIGAANDAVTNGELMSAGALPSYQQSKRVQWMQSGGTDDPYLTGLIGRVDTLSRLPADVLAANPTMVEELQNGLEELQGYADTPGAASQFRESFPDADSYDKFQRVSTDSQIGGLQNALAREQMLQQRQDNGLDMHPPRSDRNKRKDVNSIVKNFKQEHQDRSLLKLGARHNIQNSAAVESRANQLYEANLALYQGDHQRAMNATAWQMNNVDATIGNKYVVNGAQHVARQKELTPNRDIEEVAGLYLSDPDVKQRLREQGIDTGGLISFGREDTRQIRPRLNINGIKNSGMDIEVVGDNMMLMLPPQRGEPARTINIPLTSEEDAAQLMSRPDIVKKAIGDGITTAWNTADKAQEIAYADDEAARLSIEYERLRREKEGFRSVGAVKGAMSDAKTAVSEGVSSAKQTTLDKMKELYGAAPETAKNAASSINNFLFPEPLSTAKSERDYVSPRAEEARAMGIEKQYEHLKKKEAEIEQWQRKIAELKGTE